MIRKVFLFIWFCPYLFLLVFLLPKNAKAINETNPIEEVATACVKAPKKDKICATLVELKQIGDDSLEIIKTYIILTPAEYAALTLLNATATGRFRIKTKSYFIKGANEIYDFKKDSTTFLIEKNF